MIQHNGPISGIASSPNYVATAGYDNQVILWDAQTKLPIARGLHDHLANRCEFSKDERYLITASSDYTSRLWELPEMKLLTIYGQHNDDVEVAKFAPCGTMVATTSTDGRVRVFSIQGKLLMVFSGHQGQASNCVWSSDSRHVISCGDDGTIRTWNVVERTQENVISLSNVQTDSVVVARDGAIYAGNDLGEVVRVTAKGMQRLKVHSAGVKNLVLDPTETKLVSISYDRTLALIEIKAELKIVKTIPTPKLIWARSCAFRNSQEIVFGTFGSSYATLDLSTDSWDFSGIANTDCLNSVTVSGDFVYATGDSGQVRRGKISKTLSLKVSEVISDTGSLCNFITPFKDKLVCGGHLGTVFDANSGKALLTVASPINKAIQVDQYLVLGTYTGELVICEETEIGNLNIVGQYKVLENAVKDLCADGSRIFCGGAAADLAIFDVSRMSLFASRFRAHEGIINSCTALGQGRFATISRDLSLKIWSGVELESTYVTPHNHSIKCAAASTDGRFIATGSYDGKIAIFDDQTKTWPVFLKITAAGVSSLTFGQGAFYASSYDGQIYRLELP